MNKIVSMHPDLDSLVKNILLSDSLVSCFQSTCVCIPFTFINLAIGELFHCKLCVAYLAITYYLQDEILVVQDLCLLFLNPTISKLPC